MCEVDKWEILFYYYVFVCIDETVQFQCDVLNNILRLVSVASYLFFLQKNKQVLWRHFAFFSSLYNSISLCVKKLHCTIHKIGKL